MAYNIAVATSDYINIDKHFGEADTFVIIKVKDDLSYNIAEERVVRQGISFQSQSTGGSCSGCGGGGNDPKIQSKIEIISDCRCLLCNQCGPSSQKQLGKNNIATFAIDLKLKDALKKVITYYKKVDNRESFNKGK